MATGTVVTYACGRAGFPGTHEGMTHAVLARRVARLKGYRFQGEYAPAEDYERPLYFIPRDSTALHEARVLGIQTRDDLYGGIVPAPFVKTKVITHGRVEDSSPGPVGWSDDFARAVAPDVLPGYSAFTRGDARLAGTRLLDGGPVRLKDPLAAGGRGQRVVRTLAGLDAALALLEEKALAHHGLVLERNLQEVATFSVGLVSVGNLSIAYHGTQKLTRDNHGAWVYGGSDLFVVRGGAESLARAPVAAPVRRAIQQALAYDAAATRHYGVIASRRNYDVAVGVDAHGRLLSGVLEQSWRIGGASGAEIAALQAFRDEPSLGAIHASCEEVYGDGRPPPPGASVHFQGVDADLGPMTKYTQVHEATREAAAHT
ncbi:DUF3182 family protein [Myxococcaceae bacterium GXIMD 01537]